jgi:hypothetical protein
VPKKIEHAVKNRSCAYSGTCSTRAALATLARLHLKLKMQTFSWCSRLVALMLLSSSCPLRIQTSSHRFTILFFSEVIWGSLGGAGSSSSSKMAHDSKIGDLFVLLNLRGLDEEPTVSFETNFWTGVAGPLPLLGLRISPFPHPPSGFWTPTIMCSYSYKWCCMKALHKRFL